MNRTLLKTLILTAVLATLASAPSHASFAINCHATCTGGSCSCWFCGGCSCSSTGRPLCGGQEALAANCEQGSLTFIKPFDGHDTKEIDFSSVRVESAAKNGAVEAGEDGIFLYTPDPEFTGLDSFSFRVCNYSDECTVEQVLVSVNPKK